MSNDIITLENSLAVVLFNPHLAQEPETSIQSHSPGEEKANVHIKIVYFK